MTEKEKKQEEKITDAEALRIIKRRLYVYESFVNPKDKEPRKIINLNIYEGTKEFEKIMRWLNYER